MKNSSTLYYRCEKWLLPSLILFTLAVYIPVIWNDFIMFDDDILVYANPNIAAGLNFGVVRWAFTEGYEANWVPLAMLSHALDVQLFGFNPAGHHAHNLLLHITNSCLLFLFLKRTANCSLKSCVAAFLFALHPLHVESVAWVAERRDVLSMFFMMLSLYWYTRYTEKMDVYKYGMSLGCFLLGLLSKPMLVTVPLVLLLLDWWPLNRFVGGSFVDRHAIRNSIFRVVIEKIPFLVLSACSSIITYRIQQSVGELPQGYTVISRFGKSCIAYTTYLTKFIWPVDLAVLYPFSKYPPSGVTILLSIIVLVSITALVFKFHRFYPFLITGWLWYLITLLPVIGIIQIGQHSVADRYTYIPLVGPIIIVVWGFPQLLNPLRKRNILLGVGAISVIIILSWLTMKQVRYWKNSETLFNHTLSVTEGNWVIHSNLGLLYLNQGRVDEALWHLNHSIKAKPSYSLAYLNLGAVYLNMREFQKAVEAFTWSLQFDRSSPKAHYGLGIAYLGIGKRELALEESKALEVLDLSLAMSLIEIIESGKVLK